MYHTRCNAIGITAIGGDMANPDKNFPTREEIEHRAYELYLLRGGVDGSDEADWILAEEELKAALSVGNPETSKTPKHTARMATHV